MKRLALSLLLLAATAQGALAQGNGVLTRNFGEEIVRTLVWLVVAAVAFVIAFKMVDWTTPGDLKKQITEGNTALAIYVGSLAIAFALIIAALVG